MQRNHALALLALLVGPAAHASSIGSISGPLFGSGTVNSFVFGPNVMIGETITGFDPVKGFVLGFDLVFNSPGSADYFVTKTIQNNTGTLWTDFTIAVGCDPVGGTPPGTVPCLPGPSSPMLIDFGATPSTTGGGFLSNSGPTFFTFSGLNVPSPGSITFTFAIDVAAGATGIQNMYQYPTGAAASATPEPSTYLLTGAGLLGIGLLHRKRRRTAGALESAL
jgi:hypothetical protein